MWLARVLPAQPQQRRRYPRWRVQLRRHHWLLHPHPSSSPRPRFTAQTLHADVIIGSYGELASLEGPWVWAGTGTNTGFYGPWGVSYAANLTPDVSGLQIWTEDMFIRAIRTGKHMGQSRPIAPPMPWPVYRNLTDEDLAAVYAYLRTIPPVRNNVPEYEPADVAR